MRDVEPWINYFADAERDRPINLAVGRVILGGYLIWKLLSYEWMAMQAWPVKNRTTWLILWPQPLQEFVFVERWLALLAVLLFLVGYRIEVTAVVAAALVSHLATFMYSFTASGHTTSFFIAVYFLVFYAVYHTQCRLSVDELVRTGDRSLPELNGFLKSRTHGGYRADPLKWGLLALAIVYFGSGYDKVVNTPLTTWLGSQNLGRILIHKRELYHTSKPVADLLLQYPILIDMATWGTIVLEVGFVVAVLAGVTITPFVLAFLGFHTVIALAVGPFFFDLYVFFLLFVPWDVTFGWLESDEPLDIVYDERCYFCARSLYLFKLLDVNGNVRFYSQSDAPPHYRNRSDVDFSSEMYAFRNSRAYGGYHAFRELFDHLGVLRPLSVLFDLPLVKRVGVRVYRYVARHRSRHFVCNVDVGD